MNTTYVTGGHAERLRRQGAKLPIQVLILPALFDEANRMRRFTVQLMHRLVEHGIGSLLPDLPGQGESEVPLARVDHYAWWQAFDPLSALLSRSPTFTVALRGGALLDYALSIHGRFCPQFAWRLSPESGASLLRDLDRADRLGGSAEPGYAISAPLRRWMGDTVPRDPDDPRRVQEEPRTVVHLAGVRTVRLDGDERPAEGRLPGTPLWRRAEPGEDAAMVAAAAADIAQWIERCARP